MRKEYQPETGATKNPMISSTTPWLLGSGFRVQGGFRVQDLGLRASWLYKLRL